MKEYSAKQIRNIALLGHLGSGKTSLAESILFLGKAIAKKGEVARKTTVSDYTVEEQNRQTSLSTSLIPVEWNGCKINFLDTPGSEEFIGEIEQDLAVVDGAIILVDATKGIEVGTERVWDELRERNIPTIIFINKINKENVKFEKILEKVKEGFGQKAAVVGYPIGTDNNYNGLFSLISKKAYVQGVETSIPDEYHDKVEELIAELSEVVAQTDEELLEKFFMEEPFTDEEMKKGIRSAVASCDLFPIVVGSCLENIGVASLLDMAVEYIPSPVDKGPKVGTNGQKREGLDSEPFSAYVFKTVVDQFLGTINYIKINSGTTEGLVDLMISNNEQVVKAGQFMTLMGKNQINVPVLRAGDIAVVTKMTELYTTATICDKKAPICYEPAPVPTPVIYIAIQAKTKQDEDKMSSSLQKLNAEDPSFEIRRNPETAQLLVGGQGMTHIGYVLEKLRNMFKVDVVTADPKIVYRETIRAKAEAQGKHKKQSGGAGQYGDVHIRFEPCEEKFIFAEEVVGGAVPKNYFPAVEKGLIETLEHGPLAGFPVIGVKATLFYGSYHDVDSNELSFKLAAALAFKNAVDKLKPTILEPIYQVNVVIKDEYVGDIMGDITKRRGRVLGMEQGNGFQEIVAEVPEAEIIKYATDLKAMTQASGRFTRKFLRYEIVPETEVKKIVAEYSKEQK